MASRLQESGATERPDLGAATDGLAGLVDAVRTAASTGSPLAIRGGGTKSWYGHRVEGTSLDVRAHSGIVDYEPSELVLVARAGTPLREVEAVLAKNRQMLAFEPPHFTPDAAAMPPSGGDAISRAMVAVARGATLGGCVATGLSGPRRMAAGSVRDFVLGVRMIDGRGQPLTFGGQVMKNVAGYDVSRALTASLGTLGVLTEISLKVLPRPAQTVTLAFAMDEAKALDTLNRWAGLPIAITASAWRSQQQPGRYTAQEGRLLVRLEGSEAAVQSGIRRIGGLDLEPADAAATWVGLREQTHHFFIARPVDAPLWRLSLPSTAPALDAKVLGFTDQLIEWGGAQRWIATQVDASVIRDTATRLGGHATLWLASEDQKTRQDRKSVV